MEFFSIAVTYYELPNQEANIVQNYMMTQVFYHILKFFKHTKKQNQRVKYVGLPANMFFKSLRTED